MQSDYYINLHFNQAVSQRTGYAFKIGDKGCTFHLHCEDLDPTGMLPHIVFNHPNNTCVEGVPDGSGRDYTYTIQGNEFGVCGKTVVDLKFYDSLDATQRISTASFMIEIIADTYTDFEESSSSYADSLERAREEIDAAILELQDAEEDLNDMSTEFANTLQDYIDAFGNTGPINPRGAYDNDTPYVPRDAVSYTAAGKTLTYINKQACTGIAPTDPDEGAAHWQIMIDVAVGGAFSALEDVSIDPQTLANGQVPMYNSTSEKWENTDLPTESFEGCSDVDIDSTQLTGGEVPKFNHTSGKWEAGAAVDPADIENSCTSDATNKPLAAAQGKFLKDLADTNFSSQGNINLVDNGWFTINQKGFTTTSFSTSNAYTVDRWLCIGSSNGGSVTITANGLQLNRENQASTGYLSQFLEKITLGKPYTLSIMLADGTIVQKSGILATTSDEIHFNFLSDAGQARIYYYSGGSTWTVDILVYAGKSFTVRAVKLEIGTKSTLQNDVEPNGIIELLKCQKYQYRIIAKVAYAIIATGVMDDATTLWCEIPLPVPMRTANSIAYSGDVYIRLGGAIKTISSLSAELRSPNILSVYVTCSTSLTAGVPAQLIFGSTSTYIDINSNL